MALNEVIVIFMRLAIVICVGFAGYYYGQDKEKINTLQVGMAQFDKGWEEAKRYYYLDRLEEERKENERFAKENSKFSPITSDLLMAYGVTTVSQLPRNVRESYGVTDSDMRVDLDTLIRRESEEFINEI